MPESEGAFQVRPDVVAIHRAIGGYITAFSEVVSTMRHGIDRFFIPADVTFRQPDPLLETLFAQMTADPIRGAFFAISSQVGDLNDEDRAVRKALQTLVQYYIQLRNDIAHADWAVGWEDADTGEPDQPRAHRTKVGKDGIIHTALSITAEQIELEIGHLNQVRRMLSIWASECRKRQTGDMSSRPSDRLYVYKTSEAVGTAVGIRKKSGELPA